MGYEPRSHIIIPDIGPVPAPPRAHQLEARDKSRGRPGFGYFMEMGTGKTRTQLDELLESYVDGNITAVLITAPKGVYSNWWNEEFPKWTPDDLLPEIQHHLWQGATNNTQRDEINRLMDENSRLKVLSINTEALAASDRAFIIAREFVKRHRAAVIVDESTTIKNPQASATAAMHRLRDLSPMRRALSGQPVPNGPLDIWSQIDFLEKGHLGPSFYSFRAKYANVQKVKFGPTPQPGERDKRKEVSIVTGYRDLAQVRELNQQITFRKRKDECLDLPPKIYLPFRNVELTDEQRRIYREIRQNATAKLDAESHVTATLVITQMLRLHQILCGHVTDELGRVHLLPTKRVQAMLEQTEEMNGGGIIWASYRPDIERIEEAIRKAYGPDRVVSFHGGVKDADREIAKRRFNDGSAHWFVGSPQAAGRGLTLVRRSDACYYSCSPNLDHREQSEDRIHRDGQVNPCTYADLIVPGTVEEKFIRSLRLKKNLSAEILGDGYRAWLI